MSEQVEKKNNVVDIAEYMARSDAWMNAATGLGMRGKDKTRHDFFAPPRDFTQREVEDLVRGDALAARIAHNAPDDMVRAWWELAVSSEVEADDKEIDPEQANKIAAYVQKRALDLQAKKKLKRALRWDNVYGASLVAMIIDDGKTLQEPLDLDSVKKLTALHVMHRYQVSEGPKVTDPNNENFDQPEFYRIEQGRRHGETFEVIHASRVLRFQSVNLSENSSTRQHDGFGDSIFVRVWEALSDFQMAYRSVAALVADFAQGVWTIPHLHEMVTSKMESAIQKRMAHADFVKSQNNAIMVDGTLGEKYERLVTPVGGLGDLLDHLAIRLSAATGQPITKLFGTTPKGFSTEDKSGEANWDDFISSAQEDELLSELMKFIRVLLHEDASTTKGSEPESWRIIFSPLTQQTEKEMAETQKIVAEKDATYVDLGVLKPSEVRMSRFTSDGFSMDTNLDAEISKQIEEDDKKPKKEPPDSPPMMFGAPPVVPPPGDDEPGDDDFEEGEGDDTDDDEQEEREEPPK